MGYHLHGCCWIRWKKERREAYFPLKEICEVSRRQYSNCTINHIGWLRLCCTILNRVDIIWTILYPFPYHIDVIPSMWRMLRGFPWLHSHNWYSWCQGCDWLTANGDPYRCGLLSWILRKLSRSQDASWPLCQVVWYESYVESPSTRSPHHPCFKRPTSLFGVCWRLRRW